MGAYDFTAIEKKWQNYWEAQGTFRAAGPETIEVHIPGWRGRLYGRRLGSGRFHGRLHGRRQQHRLRDSRRQRAGGRRRGRELHRRVLRAARLRRGSGPVAIGVRRGVSMGVVGPGRPVPPAQQSGHPERIRVPT